VSLAVDLVDPSAYLATCQHFFEQQEALVFDCVSYDMTRQLFLKSPLYTDFT